MTYFIYKMDTPNSGDYSIVHIENDIYKSIPKNEENSDYQQYLVWLSEGNEPEEWNPQVER